MAGNCYFPGSHVFMLFEWALAAVQGQEEEFIPLQTMRSQGVGHKFASEKEQ